MRPRSKFPTDGSTDWYLANAVLLDFLLLIFSWICPPILPPRNLSTLHRSTRAHHTILQTPLTSKGLSILAELTSVVPSCFLRPDSLSSWGFVNNQLNTRTNPTQQKRSEESFLTTLTLFRLTTPLYVLSQNNRLTHVQLEQLTAMFQHSLSSSTAPPVKVTAATPVTQPLPFVRDVVSGEIFR
ncbi:hypothetical protein CRENBAI_001362 [Crenichthys baileyi]|uniref:Uncharacterized protein n=1 Tax=Crenichthys baileyi TaxID=28760 RepID=A0AAV9QWZ3_9TELE